MSSERTLWVQLLTSTCLSAAYRLSRLCPGVRGAAFQSEITSFSQDTAVHRGVENIRKLSILSCASGSGLHRHHMLGREETRLRCVHYALTGPLWRQAHPESAVAAPRVWFSEWRPEHMGSSGRSYLHFYLRFWGRKERLSSDDKISCSPISLKCALLWPGLGVSCHH